MKKNEEKCEHIGATLKSIGVLLLMIGFVFGVYFGTYVTKNPPSINNPFSEWILIRNEDQRREVVGEFLHDREAVGCGDEDVYFYAHLNSGSAASAQNFKLMCGYYSNIRIHEEYEVVDGVTWTKYCDQENRCVYGGKQGYQYF